jgi:hypothetical protein
MPHRFSIYVEDEKFLERLRQHKPATLSLSSFLGFCAEQHLNSLDTAANVPAYRVGAEDTLYVNDSVYSKQKLLQEEAPISVSKKILPHLDGDGADGVGRESEGNPRKEGCKSSARREVDADLRQHEDLIRDFWQVKQGSKADRAWSLLMTELRKIKDKYGDACVSHQIQLAINGKWKGITMQNFARFAPKEQQQPEVKHPASRVFTAKDGFAEPVKNDVLKELF